MKSKVNNTILAIITSIVAIIVPSFIFGKWVEGAFFLACHWIIRQQFKKQYHHIIPAMCRLITSVVFFFGISFMLPLSLSLFSAIPICYFISWIGFTKKQADDFEVKYNRLKEKLEKKKEFSVDECTEEELVERCKELRLSEENTRLAVEFFIKKTKQSKIADELRVEEHAVSTRKLRLKHKLNKK